MHACMHQGLNSLQDMHPLCQDQTNQNNFAHDIWWAIIDLILCSVFMAQRFDFLVACRLTECMGHTNAVKSVFALLLFLSAASRRRICAKAAIFLLIGGGGDRSILSGMIRDIWCSSVYYFRIIQTNK